MNTSLTFKMFFSSFTHFDMRSIFLKYWRPFGVVGAVFLSVLLISMFGGFFSSIITNIYRGVPLADYDQQHVDVQLAPQKYTSPSVDVGTTKPGMPGKTASLPLLATAPAGCALDLKFALVSGSVSGPGTLVYSLTASNVGLSTCDTASLSIYYADGESFVSASPAPSLGSSYYWKLGNLAAGAQAQISLTTKRISALGANDVTNEACLTANNGTDACVHSDRTVTTVVPPPPVPPASTSTATSTATSTPPLPPAPAPVNREMGTWIWTPISELSAAGMQYYIDQAALGGFNVVYVTIDEYIDIYNMPEGPAKQQKLANYTQAVSRFITLANQKNLHVDAEAGWRDWAKSANRYKGYAVLDFVANYNATNAAKFRGIQYDVEPYLLPEYESKKTQVLTDFVDFTNTVALRAKNYDFMVTFVIPHFYDSTQKWTPKVTLNGVSDYTYNHLVRSMSVLKNPKIIIMAYRNFAYGNNGTIAISQAEVNGAVGTNVKVIVAQETGPVDPDYVTFYGLSKAELAEQIGYINQQFGPNASFGGVAVHYLDTYIDL